jgi:O-antigen ligase
MTAAAWRPALAGRVSDALRRAGAFLVAAALLAGPALALVRLEELPLVIRLAWPLVCVAALLLPKPSLFLFLGVAPLLGTAPDTYRWPPVSLAALWLYALLAAVCLRVTFGKRPRTAAWPGGGIVLVAIATASLIVTLYPYQLAQNGLIPLGRELLAFWQGEFIVATSQRHLYASIVAWATLVEGLAAIWLMMRLLHDRQDVARALAAMGAGSLCVAAIGLQQWWTGSALLAKWRIFDPYITRINATFTDVNAAGAYFALLIVPVWVLGRLAESSRAPNARWGIWGWRIGAGALALALLCTGSRSAWAGALLAAAIYSFVDRVNNGPADEPWRARARRPLQVLTAVLLLVAACSIYATVRDIRHHEQRNYIDTALFTLNMRLPLDERLKGRFAFWQAGWDMWREHPWDGVGIGRYYKLMPGYLEDAGAFVVQENAHNYFLQMAAELGTTGLLALLALLVSALAAGWRAVRRATDASERRLALGLCAGVSAFLVTCLTGHSLLLHEGQLTFAPALALLFVMGREVGADASARVGAGTEAGAKAADVAGGTSRRRWSTLAGRAAVVAAVLAAFVSLPFRATAAMQAVDLSGRSTGVYGIERANDGTPFRWTAPQVTLYLPAEWRVLTLPLRALAPMPQTVRISLDERRIDEVTLVDHAWRTVTYALPPSKTGEKYHRLDLVVTPPWTPSASDNRELGIMLGDYRGTP